MDIQTYPGLRFSHSHGLLHHLTDGSDQVPDEDELHLMMLDHMCDIYRSLPCPATFDSGIDNTWLLQAFIAAPDPPPPRRRCKSEWEANIRLMLWDEANACPVNPASSFSAVSSLTFGRCRQHNIVRLGAAFRVSFASIFTGDGLFSDSDSGSARAALDPADFPNFTPFSFMPYKIITHDRTLAKLLETPLNMAEQTPTNFTAQPTYFRFGKCCMESGEEHAQTICICSSCRAVGVEKHGEVRLKSLVRCSGCETTW